jgi:hypothetical protein
VAAERPVAAGSGPPLRIDPMNPKVGVNSAPVLDRQLARGKWL